MLGGMLRHYDDKYSHCRDKPCRYDGQSLFHNVTALPSTANIDWVSAERTNRNLERISRHRVMVEEASSAMTMATE
jgi:hypothetical protein